MRAARLVLAVAGLAAGGWGLVLLADLDPSTWTSVALWLGGGVLVHDAVLAPLTVLLGVLVARRVPPAAMRPLVVGWIVWATTTAAVAAVLLPVGGKPDNASILDRPYVAWWLVLGLVWWLAVGAAAVIGSRRVART